MSFFTGLIGQWIIRRILELGGLAGAALTGWNSLPPATQEAILAVLGARWQEVTLGTLAALVPSIWGYVWSFLSTIKPQVVTADHEQIPLTKTGAREAEAVAKLAPKPRTLWDRLTSK